MYFHNCSCQQLFFSSARVPVVRKFGKSNIQKRLYMNYRTLQNCYFLAKLFILNFVSLTFKSDQLMNLCRTIITEKRTKYKVLSTLRSYNSRTSAPVLNKHFPSGRASDLEHVSFKESVNTSLATSITQ